MAEARVERRLYDIAIPVIGVNKRNRISRRVSHEDSP